MTTLKPTPGPADVGRPDALISYVQHRYSQLAAACKVFDNFQVPLHRHVNQEAQQAITAEAVMVNHQLVVATNLHPEVVEWSIPRVEAAIGELRAVTGISGVPDLTMFEVLLERDIEVSRGALELFERLPAEVQATVRSVAPNRMGAVVGLNVSRSLLALPGPFLFAWESDWHQAAKVLQETFGEITVARSSAIESLHDRMGEVESDLAAIRNQMHAAAAVMRPVERDSEGPDRFGD